MSEPTLESILNALRAVLEALEEIIKRIEAKQALEELALNSETKDFKPAIWSPPQTNEDTTEADLDALSVTDLDTWATQNKTEVDRLMAPPPD